jgi:uncharacterized protein YdeI (YjbR/CyaY-like superfamily)
VGSGRKSVTWPQAVDEALCFGWIDGVRRSIDEHAYKIRFTPRKPTSTWSRVNVARVAELTKQGRMHAAGLAAFAARKDAKTGTYTYEQSDPAELPAAWAVQLQRNAKARAFFEAQPPWYRRTSIRWVMAAKQEATRVRRFETLLKDCAAGRTIKPLTRPKGKG